jgi:hypothetical protein
VTLTNVHGTHLLIGDNRVGGSSFEIRLDFFARDIGARTFVATGMGILGQKRCGESCQE